MLTQEYADMIKADKYAKDAMETVRYAQELFKACLLYTSTLFTFFMTCLGSSMVFFFRKDVYKRQI